MGREDWEAVIGMEVHAQLNTRSKMFCGCSTDILEAAPNSHTCEVCLGLPGVLPVPNARAVEQVVKTALALGCEVARHTKFDRKNYFYPDLPKGYQISQYDLPISRNGRMPLGDREIRITRVHLEEDTGSLKHAGDALHTAEESLVDLNRAGTPLMEIVSEPDLHSAEEARDYAVELRGILRAIGASEAEMEKGQLRAEANVSVRRRGSGELGVKTELKNINSFRALQRAVAYEIERQVGLLERGEEVVQETRGWSEAEQRTFSQRSKEYAQDYRYFPEPDIPPLELDPAWVESLRAALPELPAMKRARLIEKYGLRESDAATLTREPEPSRYYEAVLAETDPTGRTQPERTLFTLAANWIIGDMGQRAREVGWPTVLKTVPPSHFAQLIGYLWNGRITARQAKEVLDRVLKTGEEPGAVIIAEDMRQQSVEDQLEPFVNTAIEENAKAVADFRAGTEAAANVVIGRVMALTRGAANPKVVRELVLKKLSGDR